MLKENDNIYHPVVLKTTHGLMLSQSFQLSKYRFEIEYQMSCVVLRVSAYYPNNSGCFYYCLQIILVATLRYCIVKRLIPSDSNNIPCNVAIQTEK